MTPGAWWATYGKHIPSLASVACSVLAQPVCASACERNWSIYGQIKRANRTRLRHHVADKLVFCHEALHMRKNLSKASSKQKAVKWDSDTDSDDSDDAHDFL